MLAALVALALVAPADPPKEDEIELSKEAQKELQKLQGKWKVVKINAKGMEYVFQQGGREMIAEYKGRKFIFTGVEKAEVVALDPTTDPKLLDMKSLEKGSNGVVNEAIFKLDGDTLTLCFYQGKGKNRPTNFDIPKDNDTFLAVFERVPADPKK